MHLFPPAADQGAMLTGILPKDIFNTAEETQDTRTAQAIEDLQTPLVVFHEPGVLQHQQMLGNGRYVGTDPFPQLTDTSFALREFIHNI